MTTLKISNNQYTGAGVIIVEDYYTKNGSIIPCLILGRNASSKLYMDFGGSYEAKHKSLNVTASTELREESANLFNINPSYLKLFKDVVSSVTKNTLYRSYFIKINGIARKYFKHNKHLLARAEIPRRWKETDRIAHIPIHQIDFDKLSHRGQIILKDIDNNNIMIHRRVKNILSNAKSSIINISRSTPIAKKQDMKIYRSKDWLNGTYCYNLS